MKKALLTVCLIFLAVIITACGGGGKSNPPNYPFIPLEPEPEPVPVVQNLELSQKIFNLNIGDTDNIIVTLNGEDVTQQVTYTPDDEAIARVENGTITALSQGTTTVTVSHEGAEDNTFTVNVIDPTLPTLEVSQDTFALKVGQTDNVTVTLEGEDVTQQVTYTPDDEAIARVESGTITALSQGSTTVTVSLEGANNAVFTVNVDLADLELSKTSYELGLGEEDTITVTCNGQPVTDSAVYTLDNNLITVEKGNIKALYQAGETTVTVSLEGANSATFTVKVIDDSDEEVTLDNDTLDKLFELNLVDQDSENKSELTELNFPGAFTYTDSKKYKIISISEGMFANCASLESIEIPNSVTTIADGAFYKTPIKEITIPDSVTSLGYAFGNCTSLEKLIIGNGLTEIKDRQFLANNGLTSLKTVTIGNSVKTIGYAAFDGTKIEEITIPNSVTTIADGAFAGTPIKEVTIPDSVTSLGYAFSYCSSLEKLTIGNGITEIQESQFCASNGLTSLKIVTIGNNVTTIGNSAFSGTKIEEITIPDSVTSFGTAFYNCKSLEKLTIGNGITEIQAGQFYELSALKTVTIGNSVKTIGEDAFSGCTSLKLTLPNQVETIGADAFLGVDYIYYTKDLIATVDENYWGAIHHELIP